MASYTAALARHSAITPVALAAAGVSLASLAAHVALRLGWRPLEWAQAVAGVSAVAVAGVFLTHIYFFDDLRPTLALGLVCLAAAELLPRERWLWTLLTFAGAGWLLASAQAGAADERWLFGGFLGASIALAAITSAARRSLMRQGEAKQRAEALFNEGFPDTILRVDSQGRILERRRGAAMPAELIPAECGSLQEIMSPPDAENMLRAVRAAMAEGAEQTFWFQRSTPASGLELEARVAPVGSEEALIVVRDCTAAKSAEQQRLVIEQQVREAQRRESLSTLAGGVAHDFNNLLVAILGNADLAIDELPEDSPVGDRLHEIRFASQRAADLTNQMLAYSGRGSFLVEPLDLSTLISETSPMIERVTSDKANLRLRLGENLPKTIADRAQLKQALLHLATNASDALGNTEGWIEISSGCMDVDFAEFVSYNLRDVLPEGRYLYLQVRDNGCGMDPETRQRIFDPFFTTKFTGRGLGLAAVLGIVHGHRGAIRVQSVLGEGSTVRILLPLKEHLEAAKAEGVAAAAEDATRGAVLVVDDDLAVRRLARMTLEKSGFTVLTAHTGNQGIKLLAEHRTEIAAVLLDLTMPDLSGEETLAKIRQLAPRVPVILTSGYSKGHFPALENDPHTVFLQKPYERQVLLDKIHEMTERE